MSLEKEAIRKAVLKARAGLTPEEAKNQSAAALNRLINEIVPQIPLRPRVIGVYSPIKNEISPLGLLSSEIWSGVQYAFPRIEAGLLEFHTVKSLEELVLSKSGILEPRPSAPVAIPDVFIVPGVAFSRSGGRIGYGKAYYDKSLAHFAKQGKSFVTIGYGYELQLLETLPLQEHDWVLDWIVTDCSTIRVSK